MSETLRILLIADDLDDRRAFEQFVKCEGLPYDYRTAASVAEARAALSTEHFDLVLMDYPLEDDLLDQIEDTPVVVMVETGTSDEPIPVTTTRTRMRTRMRTRQGIRHYVPKGPTGTCLTLLPVIIEQTLEHWRVKRELAQYQDHFQEMVAEQTEELQAKIDQQQQVEETLRKSEERFRQIYQHMAVGVAQIGMDFRIKWANAAYCRMLGYSQEELIGKHLKEITHPEIVEENLRQQSLLATGEIDHYRLEKQFIHKSGRTIHGILDANLVRDAEGQPLYFLGSVLDITERRQMETALRESEERLSLTLRGANIGLWDWNVQTGEVVFNEQWAAMLGYDLDELTPHVNTWETLVHPADWPDVMETLNKHLEGEIPFYETEHRMRAKDGTWRWVLDRGTVLTRDEAGNPLRAAGTHLDITKRKRIEKALQESERQKNLILNSTTEMVAYYDTHLRVIWANKAASESVGKRVQDLTGLHCYEIWQQRDEPCIDCPVLKARDQKTACQTEQQTPDGRCWSLRGYPVLDEAGEVIALVEFGQDITERKQAEEALRESEKQYRNLFNSIADAVFVHDLEGRILDVNDQACANYGYTRQELEQMQATDIDAPEHATHIKERIETLVERGEITIESVHLDREQNRFPVEITAKLARYQGQDVVISICRDITERQQAAEALRKSEWLNRLVAEMITDYIFIVDVGQHGTLTLRWASENMLRMTGRTVSDAKTSDMWRDIIHPDDTSAFFDFVEGLIASGESDTIECRTFIQTGMQRWIQISALPQKDEHDDVVSIVGAISDITERKRAEEALRESEAIYRSLAENFPNGALFLFDQDFRYLAADGKALTQAGLSSEQIVGLTVKEVFPELWDRIRPHCEAALLGQESYYEVVYGGRLYSNQALPIISDAGLSHHAIVVVQDITEHRQAEEERERLNIQVHEQARQMERILTTVPAGVLLLDAEGRVLQANPKAEQALSTLSDARMNQVLTRLGDRPLAELLTSPPTQGLWHEIKTDKHTFEVIAQPMEPALWRRPAHLTNVPQRTRDRDIPDTADMERWVLVINDVTREREIQAQLQQQERLAAVGQLAAGIAHDFNNIMASIVLYAQMMEQSQGLSQRDRERMQVINQQAWHATRLIAQILDFSRRAVLERRPLDLLPLLKEHVKLLKRTLPEHIQIQLDHDQEEHTVNADPTRMQQMLTNLAVNARDAMPEGGTLHIKLEQITVGRRPAPPMPEMEAGRWIQLTVSDTGKGIPPEVMPHIFEPFFTTKGPGEGSGLGLAQVHGIVGAHGGQIDVKSRVGKGTTFTIYLPVLTASPIRLSSTHAAITPQGQAELVLVVEDNDALRAALIEILELLGYRGLGAANGKKALALMEQQGEKIDLVLSDVVMPGMGGLTLLKQLREKGWQTPMILITGHPMEKELEELRSQKLSAWLTKPPSIDQLAQALADALHSPTNHREE